MALINVELVSDGDGIKLLEFRADQDYLLDAGSLHCPAQAFGELEVSNTNTRRSGLFLRNHAWDFTNDVLTWTGWVILREGEFVLGHIDLSENNDLLNMRLHLNAIRLDSGLSVLLK